MLSIDESVLKRAIGTIIIAIIIIIFANRKLGLEERMKKGGKKHEALGYGGFFGSVFAGNLAGGGGGILSSYVLMFFYGLTFLQSAGTRKVAGVFAVLIGSLVYIFSGIIIWDMAIPMAISSLAGAWLGSHYAIKKGDSFVRSLFLIIAALVTVFLFIG